MLRRLEAHREGREGREDDDKRVHDVVLIEGGDGDAPKAAEDKWAYSVGDKKAGTASASASSTASGSKELEEVRFQPDVK